MFHSVTTMTSVVRGTRAGWPGVGRRGGGGARMSPALVPTTDVPPMWEVPLCHSIYM